MFIKKNLKLLLLGLITPLLVNFTNAFDLSQSDLNYINSVALSTGTLTNYSATSKLLYDFGSVPSSVMSLCLLIEDPQYTSIGGFYLFNTNTSSSPQYNSSNPFWSMSDNYSLFCRTTKSQYFWYMQNQTTISFKYYLLNASDIFNGNLGLDISGLTSQLSACNSNLSSCQSALNTATGSLASCQNDLNTCQNNGASCDTLYGVCVENLSGCNADKVSLNNNIDSLTLQLQNCLGQSCNGSGDNGTGLYFNQYSLYRTDDEIDYSTPITNNLFLPLGYKGKINEDNILSISKINTLEASYQFSEEDKVNIIDIFSTIMIFLLATGGLISIIMFLKRLFLKR